MFNFFSKKDEVISNYQDFNYLASNDYYFDSACQTLRPQQVIDAEVQYYHEFNSCGHRVKYKWGEETDKRVMECRENILKLAGKSSKDYVVAFCLNTTHGINTVLHQLNSKPPSPIDRIPPNPLDRGKLEREFFSGEERRFERIVTSEIEHNSVFLSSLTWANRHGVERLVLERVGSEYSPLEGWQPKADGVVSSTSSSYPPAPLTGGDKKGTQNTQTDNLSHGSLLYQKNQLEKAVVILNTMSNIDGQELVNAKEIAKDVHEMGGILLLDACQTFGHHPEFLEDIDFDAAFGSGHKMYGPSVGFIIIKKSLLRQLDCYLIGGSTVQDVKLDSFELVENEEELYARIEPGLQNYAGIIGLNEAIKWRKMFVENLEKSPLKRGELKARGVSLHLPSTSLPPSFEEGLNQDYEQILSEYLHQKLQEVPNIKYLNPNPSSVVSLYSDKMDGHKMAMYLSEVGIMCRSGYHCCHYYLKEKLNLPPLMRISLGLHNTPEQIDFLVEKLKLIMKNFG